MNENKNLIEINKFGQDLIELDKLKEHFEGLNFANKESYLNDLMFLLLQTKPIDVDAPTAIELSNLKPTHTPCVLLKKGVEMHNLERIVNLPQDEWNKTVVLLLCLFKVAYKRKLTKNQNDSSKWWFGDLSNN